MKKKLVVSIAILSFGMIGSVKAGHACSYGPVTCNTLIGTACDGQCEGDVCSGTQVREYSCSDGTITFVNE